MFDPRKVTIADTTKDYYAIAFSVTVIKSRTNNESTEHHLPILYGMLGVCGLIVTNMPNITW